ncbi:PREDICTED: 2_6554_02 partial [Prunus dulcis]|uniref:PREDICTED: 2_6554_02 partial n=1 Tax=Prunus dulcis TaxID=3755 RepID=A0A5E4GHZ2_PRUDU|nr:PREDICTED: 2_6554_02 partial [Prunus dulcis]
MVLVLIKYSCINVSSLRGILSGTCSTMGDFSIQISSNLVDKLVHDAEKSKRKPRRTKIKVPREPQQPQMKTNQKQVSDDSETAKGTGAKGWPLQPPIFVPVTPPSQSTYAELDAIRSVLQESRRVLERLQKQEENMVQEVTQRAKELRDKEFKLPFQKPMPCLTEKDACLACYKEHADNPLKCAGFVKSFEDCARRIRQQVGSAEK